VTPAEREREALTVLDSLHQHIALLDPQGTVVAVNRAWLAFGVAQGADPAWGGSVGSNYLDICGAADPGDAHAGRASAGIAAVLAGELPHFELEYPCHGPTGQRWFQMRVSPLVGKRPGAVVSHDEITARWQLEQQRAELIAELLTANQELTEFAHVVSHDLKAPLRGISTLATWLQADHAAQLDATGREHVALIGSRVRRLSALIDGILAYSRAGRSQDTRVAVPLDTLVQNTIELLAPPARVRVRVEGSLPPLLMPAVKIQQVFQNLLSNAIDFMDKPDGEVVVRCVREGACWHFTVADNGPGIEPRHFQRIFQLFQTLASRDDRERTGVGLALVKKIVELEGGSVWVTSSPGAGATFHFTLPAALAEAA